MPDVQFKRINTANGYEVDLIHDGDELRIDLRGTVSWWTRADLDLLISALQAMAQTDG